MIRTRLSYDGGEIYINPKTISYITRYHDTTVIGLTNGHTYEVTASLSELLGVLENEATKIKFNS